MTEMHKLQKRYNKVYVKLIHGFAYNLALSKLVCSFALPPHAAAIIYLVITITCSKSHKNLRKRSVVILLAIRIMFLIEQWNGPHWKVCLTKIWQQYNHIFKC